MKMLLGSNDDSMPKKRLFPNGKDNAQQQPIQLDIEQERRYTHEPSMNLAFNGKGIVLNESLLILSVQEKKRIESFFRFYTFNDDGEANIVSNKSLTSDDYFHHLVSSNYKFAIMARKFGNGGLSIAGRILENLKQQ